MAFVADIRQWPTARLFAEHLAHHDPHQAAPWAQGVVIHHTWRPLPADWRGARSMRGLAGYYTSLGWDRGPHLVVCLGAPDWRDDGIWQLTPLNERGIHAGPANATHWGIEVVGDYDAHPWPPLLAELVSATAAALLRWRGLTVTPATLKGHRECGSPKTCPGRAIDLDAVRAELRGRVRYD